MPVRKAIRRNGAWVPILGPALSVTPPTFISGVTRPAYVPTVDFSGAKNIGNLPGVALTPYSASSGGSGEILQLAAGTYENIDFGNRRVDPRGVVTLSNCRVVLTTSAFEADSIGSALRYLNGSTSSLLVANDCEFHNRAQRLVDVFKGRNFEANRCVFTGGVDGVDTSTGGSAPQNFGLRLTDCWIGDHAWFYYTSTGVVHPSDTQTHNDGTQVADTNGVTYNNVFFGTWPSEFVGTGTPGSGSDAGNAYVASYISNQAQMASWRASFLNLVTRADQSFDGVQRKTSTGGSWASIMGNRSNGAALHCYFSGGGVHVNLTDVNLETPDSRWSIKQCVAWNDMSQGHSLTGTTKGTSIYLRTAGGRTFDVPTSGADRNLWFDGTTVTPATI